MTCAYLYSYDLMQIVLFRHLYNFDKALRISVMEVQLLTIYKSVCVCFVIQRQVWTCLKYCVSKLCSVFSLGMYPCLRQLPPPPQTHTLAKVGATSQQIPQLLSSSDAALLSKLPLDLEFVTNVT